MIVARHSLPCWLRRAASHNDAVSWVSGMRCRTRARTDERCEKAVRPQRSSMTNDAHECRLVGWVLPVWVCDHLHPGGCRRADAVAGVLSQPRSPRGRRPVGGRPRGRRRASACRVPPPGAKRRGEAAREVGRMEHRIDQGAVRRRETARGSDTASLWIASTAPSTSGRSTR